MVAGVKQKERPLPAEAVADRRSRVEEERRWLSLRLEANPWWRWTKRLRLQAELAYKAGLAEGLRLASHGHRGDETGDCNCGFFNGRRNPQHCPVHGPRRDAA